MRTQIFTRFNHDNHIDNYYFLILTCAQMQTQNRQSINCNLNSVCTGTFHYRIPSPNGVFNRGTDSGFYLYLTVRNCKRMVRYK